MLTTAAIAVISERYKTHCNGCASNNK